MAATVTSSAWAKPGAWALDSEEHEEELKQEPANGRGSAAPMSEFPDLLTAAATKTKKKKAQTLTDSTNKPSNQSYQPAKGLTHEDMLNLPTGPRQRTAEEYERTRLGGGFRSYGINDDSRRTSKEPLPPSRADETNDWGAAKKSPIGGGGFDRRERGGAVGGGYFEGSHSRADESDSWASNKSYRPTDGRKRENRMGFESSGDADTSDNWAKKKEVDGRRFGNSFDSLTRDRRTGNDTSSDSDNWGRKKDESSGVVSLSRPKLNLQPRTAPVGDVETVKPTKGSNPFGDARPREEVLKEKGEDLKDIDGKLNSMKLKDVVVSGDRFKTSTERLRSNEDSTEKSWRKAVDAAATADVSSPSGEKSENGQAEEPEATKEDDAQM